MACRVAGWQMVIVRTVVCLAASLTIGSFISAQEPKFRAVRPPGGDADAKESTSLAPGAIGGTITRVSQGDGYLPQEHGQQWREYDIEPYTSRVTGTENPQQAIVDWILRDTGTEVWFSEPLGILSASRTKLRVYHTPEMHDMIQQVVDRFVSSRAESHVFSLRLVTVGSPNWRSKALPLMQSVSVQSPGVDAWLLSKENAAVLVNDLRKRLDFKEHNSPNLMIHNGQSQTVSRLRPRNYARTVHLRQGTIPSFEVEMGQIQEGFSLQISPLLALDERTVDAVVRCHIDQVEKLVPISIDIPGGGLQRQTADVQVPQIVSWRLHERFRWPTQQVLLLSCGVVATPSNERSNPFSSIPNLLTTTQGRADALLFIESNGKASQTLMSAPAMREAKQVNPNYRGRY